MGTECDRMPRHVTRTYAKVKETPSSRAFDEIFSDKMNKPTAARATIHKWGKTSFTSVRGARETAFDLKRRRAEPNKRANQDPFTFELDDGPSSPRKRRTQGAGVTTVLTPAVARQVLKEYKAVSANESQVKEEVLDDDDEEISLLKKPVKTYTRQPLSKPLPVNKGVEKSSENCESASENLSLEKSEDKLDTQLSSSQTSAISLHSSVTSQDVSDQKTTDDQSDMSDEDLESFKPQTSKTYSSGELPGRQSGGSSPSSSPAVKDAEKTPVESEESSRRAWEKRNVYKAKMVYRSPSKTPQNPSRQETLTIIRVSPPAWFKKGPGETPKGDASDSDTDVSSKNSVSKLTYESQTYKKVASSKESGQDTFDFESEGASQLAGFANRKSRPKRKFFKSRKGETSEEENESVNSDENKNLDYVPSQAEARLVAEIFGDDMSEGPDSNKSETVESEVNDSEPEMPKLSPAPQMSENDSAASEVNNDKPQTTTTNGNNDNPEPPVLKTYTRRREKPVRYENKEPKKFFKSKNQPKAKPTDDGTQKKIFTSPKKSPSKALYNPRTWKVEDEDEPQRVQPKAAAVKKKAVSKSVFDDDFDEDPVADGKPKLMRTVVWPKQVGDEAFTSLHVNREHKELFTVVRNVKQAHECQEIGETQEFMDDIEYLLVGLRDTEPTSVRCLSCVSLATKCTMASFRMHLRAHGVVAMVFSALHDAFTDASLSLCTASIMFMLSRDRLNMDLDRPSLDLLLKLLGVEQQEDEGSSPSKLSSAAAKELRRTKDRIKELIQMLQKEGGLKAFDLETVSTGNLAMESLLSLTSRRAGEVFKEELRILGALDHIVDTVCHCANMMEGNLQEELTDLTVEYFHKVERCLRVLEQVTYCNTDNQDHLISYKEGALVSAISRTLSVCEQSVSQYPVQIDTETLKVDKSSIGWAIHSCMLSVLRVLLNLTHENEFGCTQFGEQENFFDITLLCTLKSPQYVPQDTRFDLLVLSVGTMINLVEHCDVNRRRFISANTITSFECSTSPKPVCSLEGIIGLFKLREEAARRAETEAMSPDGKGKTTEGGEDANQSGSWQESQSGLEWVVNPARSKPDPEKEAAEVGSQENKEQDDEEYFTKALHKAGKHMEDSIVAAYIALLLGCVIQDNQEFVEMVKQYFEDGEFMPMIRILKKFLGFMNLTTAITTSGGKSIARVIEILENCG